MEDNVHYVFSEGGFLAVPDVAYQYFKEDVFTTEYARLFDGLYIHATEEQIAFNLANPGLDIYRAFNMITKTTEEKNEEIRQRRQTLYTAKTDKLYMAYVKYKEFGEEEKAAEAFETWKAAVAQINEDNPYID